MNLLRSYFTASTSKFSRCITNGTVGPQFLIRSCFFPKKTRKAFESTGKLQPDVVILDLEDSVESHQKPSLRKLYLQALGDGVFSNTNVFVRSSPLNCYEELLEDIKAFTGSKVIGFMLPKVESSECILEVEQLIAQQEERKGLKNGTIKLIPLVETPAANFSLNKIASCTKRNVAILAGSGDFTATVVCDDHSPTYDTFFSNAVLAAKASNIVALCGVHDKIDDHIGFEKFCLKMKQSGFNGVVALTPKQVSMANYIFSMSPTERKWTESVLGDERHLKTIQRSVQESRQMIGPPHKIKAENMLKGMTKISTKPRNPIKGNLHVNGLCPDLSIGEVVNAPFEAVVAESWKALWECSFISTSSNPVTIQSLPFTLAATMAVAFSVSTLTYHARVHLAFKNIFQERPFLVGDRVRAMFRIDGIETKTGSDSNQYSVANSTHWLVNQNNEVVLQLEKVTMFQPDHCKLQLKSIKHTKSLDPKESSLRKKLLSYPCEDYFPLASQQVLTPGQLIVHDLVKVMGHSETRMLCTLLHIVNPHHHNIMRYNSSDLLVPGPFVMSAGISIANLELGQVIYEDIPICINPNKVNFGDQLGVLTYIIDCKEVEGTPEFEEVTVKHLVIKNVDTKLLSQMDIPVELLEGDTLKPSEYERLCSNYCPLLLHKIVCVVVRKAVRVRSGILLDTKIPNEL